MNDLGSVIRALGFTTIYWVDDDNAKPEDIESEKLLGEVVDAVAKQGVEGLKSAMGKAPANWKDELTKLKKFLEANEKKASDARVDMGAPIDKALRALANDSDDPGAALAPMLSAMSGKLSDEERSALDQVFKPTADQYAWKPLSFSDWGSQRDTILESHDEQTPALVLLDQQNTRDKSSLNGIQILQEVFARPERSRAFKFLVVTNTCTPDTEFEHAASLIRDLPNIDKGIRSPLFAMSKQRISRSVLNAKRQAEAAANETVAAAGRDQAGVVAHALKGGADAGSQQIAVLTDLAAQQVVMAVSVEARSTETETNEGSPLTQDFTDFLSRLKVSLLNQQLTEKARSILLGAMDAAFTRLSEITLHEFMFAVTNSSPEEGVSELDTLLRLIGIEQRAALLEQVHSDTGILSTLQQIRDYRVTVRRKDLTSSPELATLRSKEVFSLGSAINRLAQPIALGDIFKFVNCEGKNRYFVLLANECDLMLRSKGDRAAKTLLLAELTDAALDLRIGAELVYPWHEQPTLKTVSLNKVMSVPAEILDLCWTNILGKCEWRARKNYRTMHLLESQANRLSSLAELFSSKEERGRIMRKSPFYLGASDSRDGITNFNLTRVTRINAPYAQGLLSKLGYVLSRPSYEHNFLPNGDAH